MRFVSRRAALAVAIAAAFPAIRDAHAVRLGTDGLGQALIFPYYSAQTAVGSPLNTYLSVVNHTADAKAIRVRFREGRMGALVLEFNLFLSPNDVWTGAVVPSGDGAMLLTRDVSCTDPPIPSQGVVFPNYGYTGALGDGAGTGLDRTREGYVEMIEMATLTGTSAAAITHNSAGVPANCAAVQGFASVATAPPSGGLSGTFTLINVANGMEFSTNAEALAELSKQAFFRAGADPYPDWNAAEIDPVSVVVANGSVYRSIWSHPVDAVSAVLMRSAWQGEYVLDAATDSRTDIVLTFPARRFYANASGANAPFTKSAWWSPDCTPSPAAVKGEVVVTPYYNRESRGPPPSGFDDYPLPPVTPQQICATAAVVPVGNGPGFTSTSPSVGLLGSHTGGFTWGVFTVQSYFQNGWFRIGASSAIPISSAASSMRMDGRTGAVVSGPHSYSGLPVVGFTVRSMTNGQLTCSAGRCQGNYGGAFPLKFSRTISP